MSSIVCTLLACLLCFQWIASDLLVNMVDSAPIPCSKNWRLHQTYQGHNFFDAFRFFTPNWNTGDFANYVNKSEAESLNMITATEDYIVMRVDNTPVSSDSGRNSIRLESTAIFNSGSLLVMNLTHMPQGCGTHSAWWTSGPQWPDNGEIDIIEEINLATKDQSTLHTNASCTFFADPSASNITGIWGNKNCTSSHSVNHGCDIHCSNENSYGVNFNEHKGGLFVVQWTDDGIFMWFWSASEQKYPSDIFTNPDTCAYGIPYAGWAFNDDWCAAKHFLDHTMILDTSLCGGWAGGSNWNHSANSCAEQTGYDSCNDYVQNNGNDFDDAYWKVYSIKIFDLP